MCGPSVLGLGPEKNEGRRIQGAERERWSKTEMDEQGVRDCGVKGKLRKEGQSTVAVATMIGTAEHRVLVYNC